MYSLKQNGTRRGGFELVKEKTWEEEKKVTGECGVII